MESLNHFLAHLQDITQVVFTLNPQPMKHFKAKLMYSCFPVLQTGPYLTSPRTTVKLIPNTPKNFIEW